MAGERESAVAFETLEALQRLAAPPPPGAAVPQDTDHFPEGMHLAPLTLRRLELL